MSGLDELRELHMKLGQLLDDPQPGLATWRLALSQILLELAKYAGAGPVNWLDPKPPLGQKRRAY
jgi:hypothetical protein